MLQRGFRLARCSQPLQSVISTRCHVARPITHRPLSNESWPRERSAGVPLFVSLARSLTTVSRFAESRSAAPGPPALDLCVDLLVEGNPILSNGQVAAELADKLELDGTELVQQALAAGVFDPEQSCSIELSVVLCDDNYITDLNREHRGKAAPTDVLSFPAVDWDFVMADAPLALGDVVVSLNTAERQAAEQGHSVQDECRILLLHGLLHLVGHDHELGPDEAANMARQEQQIMQNLGWKGAGLISSASVRHSDTETTDTTVPEQARGSAAGNLDEASTSDSSRSNASGAYSPGVHPKWSSDIRLLALDMDGTLLDSNSKVLPSSVKAIQAAMKAGVIVCLATGKARPAALAALTPVGLAGEGLVVWQGGPGIFLQGLDTYSSTGMRLPSVYLKQSIIRAGFEYANREQVPLCGFLGDDCVTLQHTPEIQALHDVYYEPLAKVMPSLDAILQGPPVMKLLFMTDPRIVDAKLKPDWTEYAAQHEAETMQAVSNMLELVPTGVNKGSGMRKLLANLKLPAEAVMAIGDGGNDLPLLQSVGLGVAMGNAVPHVLAAANATVANNNDGGIAEAIERFIL